MSNENESTGRSVGSWLNDVPLTGPENYRSSINGSYEPGRDRLILGNGDMQSGTEQPRTSMAEDFLATVGAEVHDPGYSLDIVRASADRELAEKLEKINERFVLGDPHGEKQKLTALLKGVHQGRMFEITAIEAQRARNAQRAVAAQQAEAEREVWMNQQANKRADEMEVEELAQKIRAERRRTRGY